MTQGQIPNFRLKRSVSLEKLIMTTNEKTLKIEKAPGIDGLDRMPLPKLSITDKVFVSDAV